MMFALIVGFCLAREIDITEDGKVKKTILREGMGAIPQKDQEVVIHYVGVLPEGNVFDSSRDRSEFHFRVGRGVIPGWSVGVASMKVGELANFTFDYAYGYGERGYPPVVPPMSQLMFQIELLAIQ
jgi:FKBP-type peptidyl-prolyl cis-trans isomerase